LNRSSDASREAQSFGFQHARDQIHQRRFATAGAAYESNRLARFNGQVNIPQDRFAKPR